VDCTQKPGKEEWLKDYKNTKAKEGLLEWLIDGCCESCKSNCDCHITIPEHDEPPEFEGYDGWYNNLAHPELGAVGKTYFL